MPSVPALHERLIVALDAASVAEAERLIARLGPSVGFYKVGMELAYAEGGFEFVARLARSGRKVFLDLKLHDIPVTVERATAQVARLGASFLTVHAYPQTMRAARAGAGSGPMRLLAVTVLTSMDEGDLREAGYAGDLMALVLRRARMALEIGMDGLILAPSELEKARAVVGPAMTLVCPGIRLAGGAAGDQKRIMTPAAAIAAGADYLVVGRPVTQADDPNAAAQAIMAEIAEALARRS